jgi:hypothetical protein
MVSLGGNDKQRYGQILQQDSVAAKSEAALGQVVMQIEPTKVLAMHARRHARGVRIPGS